jgi:hypothetical protein
VIFRYFKFNFLANEIFEGTDAWFIWFDASLAIEGSGDNLPRSVLLPKFNWELLELGLEQVVFDFF